MSEIMLEVNLLNQKITEISECIENQNFESFNQEIITKMSESNILLFLNHLVNCIKLNQYYKYKFLHYEKTVKLAVDIIIKSNKLNKKIDLNFNNLLILKIISNVTNSHLYLNKIKNYIKTNNFYNLELLFHVAEKSTLPVFLFWWNTFYKTLIFSVEDYITILSLGLINTDDRIYQFILDLKNIQNINNIFTEDNKKLLLIKLLSSYFIPRKHIQKKIKTLSLHMDLSTELEFMLITTFDIKMKKRLLLHYYNIPLTFNIIKNLVANCCFDYITALSINNLLKTQEEKYIFTLLCNLHGYYHENIVMTSIKSNILDEHKDYVIEKINSQMNIIYEYSNFSIGLNNIFNYYKSNNSLQEYIMKNYSDINVINLIKYTKFFVLPENVKIGWLNKNVKINKALHLLRCMLKKYSSNKFNNFNYIYKPIINEVKNFKPNGKYKVLTNGSLGYQLNFQKYNTIPPRHILPLENILYKNYLIKEKADGILTSILPTKIYPHVKDIYDYEIKAEFIEDLNIYLIFDINIPNITIIERQHYLRSIHPDTANIQYTPNVTNFEMLLDEINKERNVFKNFMEESKGEFKWYPKGSWKIFMNENIYINLLSIIEENNDKLDFILNGEFNCDGLILTPLDGSRELKIKPKKLQTIDLLYNGSKWLDSNNKEWNIEKIPNKKYQNKIYRCYPEGNKYVATEIRYDKKKPNNGNIIDQIQNITKFNWLESVDLLINIESYYEISIKLEDSNLITILNYQKSLLGNMIKEFNPESNKNWLDLGCGKCKLFEIIRNTYFPKKYTGIDNDARILSKKYNIVDESNSIVTLYPCNLNDQWDKVNLWNSFDWTIKYDYIIANFSIMHFWSELFWEQLNKVTKSGSILLFNVVKENSNWSYNKSYLNSTNNETKIFFEWTHKKEHIEKLITDELINNTLVKYNWTIKHKITPHKSLSSCYDWYIILKS